MNLWRKSSPRRGSGDYKGTSYRFSYSRKASLDFLARLPGDQGIKSFSVEIDSPSALEFTISREGDLDRFSKRIGLSEELQTGDSRFDAEYYIRSDTVALTRTFFDSPERRDALRQILSLGYTHVTHCGGTMSAVWQNAPNPEKHSPRLGEVLPSLVLLAKGAAELPPTAEPLRPGDSLHKLARAPLLAIPTVMLAGAFAMTGTVNQDRYVLDAGALFLDSLWYSVPAFLGYIALAAYLLKGRSSTHRELIAMLVSGFLGFPFAVVSAESFLNAQLDEGAAAIHTTLAFKKEQGSSDAGFKFVTVRSWRANGSTERLLVSQSAFDRVVEGQSAFRVVTKPGRYGFEWVVSSELESAGPVHLSPEVSGSGRQEHDR